MYHSRNNSTLNRNPINQNIPLKKKNYLTESSCDEIQKVLRKDYFNRLQRASLNNLINYINEDELPRQSNLNLEEMNEKPLKYAAKQILFSDKIRKNNYKSIKRHPRKKNYNETDAVKMHALKFPEDFKNGIEENNEKKNTMFKAKKIYKDKYPIYYDFRYIDDIENKFIKPYLSKDNLIYKDYIENKKSKMPFNFVIG